MRAVFKAFSYLSTMAVHPLSWSFYLSFIFIVAFVFLNMMIGIVLETLQREHEQFDRDSSEGEAGEVHQINVKPLREGNPCTANSLQLQKFGIRSSFAL
jgi:voltage-gated sodium channel